jgi:membrane fusion protein, multidrug efflux system
MKKREADEIKRNWPGRHRHFLMWGILAILAGIGSLYYYLTGGRYMSTDDAYIKAAQLSVSSDISARVSEIPLIDNQPVHQGDMLLRLDERPFAIAVQEAGAQLAGARLQVSAMKAGYRQKLADFKSAESTLTYQQREYDRQKKLAGAGISSQAQLDKATQMLHAAQQEQAAQQQAADTALANLGGNPAIDIDDHPLVREAQAKLDRARLNLSYTAVYAPIDGIVTKVEHLQVGDYVTKGMPLFAIVSGTDLWVEANFKETALTYMRPGQKARIAVDAFPGKELSGEIASLSPGTGSSFSLLPPENATGNWVKIVQRVPVRIAIDSAAGVTLRAGMSVTAVVDTEHRRTFPGF